MLVFEGLSVTVRLSNVISYSRCHNEKSLTDVESFHLPWWKLINHLFEQLLKIIKSH